MPKVEGPLFSLEAGGTFQDTITYQRYKGGTRVITKPVPTNEPSDTQLYYRYIMQRLRADWSNQSADTKAYWNQLAEIRGGHSGYNLYIQSQFQFIRHYDCFTALYLLNENTSNNIYDVSINQNQGMLTKYTSGDPITWATGKNYSLGPALSFPGIGTYVDLGNNPQLTTQNFTIELWANAAQIDSDLNTLFCLDALPFGLWIAMSSSYKICVLFADGSAYSILSGTTQPQPNTWYHIVLTGENGFFRLYINSIQENSGEETFNVSSPSPQACLGASKIYLNYGNHFSGKINQCACYSRALNPDEILYNFNRFNSD